MDPSEETRFSLLGFTYHEVLAATKHQDEKINKLLTAVAFLVAGSLALANLADGKLAMRSFVLDVPLPLALVTLGVFLVGVLAAVVLLIGTMTTALRFPGGSRPDAPEITYATSFEAGQVYFNEIASGSLAQWHKKWQQGPTRLWRERNESLVRETHNLAVRAEHKYARTNEAVAVLSFALLSFALSVVLVLRAAAEGLPLDGAEEIDDVPADWRLRLVLAAVLLSYCWLQLRGSARGEFQSVADLAPFPEGTKARWWSRCVREKGWVRTVAYPLAVAGVPTALVAVPPGRVWGAWLVGGLCVVAFLLLLLTLPWHDAGAEEAVIAIAKKEAGPWVVMPGDDGDELERRDRRRVTNRRNRWVVTWSGLAAVVIGVIGSVAVCREWQAVQLLTAYVGSAGLLVAALAATVTRQRRRVAKYASLREVGDDQAQA
ncbi:hypothetical protein ACI8AK_02450 [Geodermatophilus sp. SYSU D00867]